ncbi:MAG: EAL domain-containing protein [Marinobacter sp.]|nr:EAL domain-containing protein [Marinobacter sp.]
MSGLSAKEVSTSPKRQRPMVVYLWIMAVLVVSASLVAFQNYRQTTETAWSRSAARADLAAEIVAGAFMSSRYGLQTLAGFIEPLVAEAGVAPGGGIEGLEQALDEKVELLKYLDELFIANARGSVLYASGNSSREQVPGWPFIREHVANVPGDDLVTPLYQNPETGKFSIWKARKLLSRDGKADAFIVARQSPEVLISFMARVSLSEGQSIAILDNAMTLVGRLPGTDGSFLTGTRVREPYTREFISSQRDSSQVVTSSPVDSKERLYSFKRVRGAPYVVIVGEEISVIMQSWWQNLWITVIGLLLLATVGLFLVRQFHRREVVEQELVAENHERKDLQQSAQASEARLRALINSIPDLIFVFDERGRFVFVHAADESRLSRPVDQILGQHYRDILPPQLASQLENTKAEIARTGQATDLEYQLEFDGEVREFSAKVTVLIDAEHRNTGFLAVVRDVTESKIQEAELRIASTAFETHLGITITDDQGVILRANKAFTRITGYEEHEVVGKTPAVLQSGLQDRAFYENFWNRVKEAGSWEGEVWNRRKNGEIYAEWLTVTAVRGQSGRVLNYVGTFHDITKRKEAERQAHRLAFYDSLTGLANRVLLEDRILEAAKANTRFGTQSAILQLDINQFRAVNDTRGYGVGDLVLKAVSEQLASIMRESDTLARIGGDEFAVLLSNLDSSKELSARSAEVVAEKILGLFEYPLEVPEHSVQVAVSIGITIMNGEDTPWDQQMQRAEQATQQAKQQARHQGGKPIAFFDPDIQARAIEHILLEDELRHAVAEGQLRLYFQPQIRNPEQLLGYEVLLRWQHPDRGLISPGVFIPLAEQSRLILPIGEWVLEQACEQLARWQEDPDKKDLYLAVNVSVYQFQNKQFTEQVARILQHTGAPPHLLKLEVTESLLMDDPERITRMMNDLRALGIRFSLDDFGTGYSSLSYLKRLPLDQVKIDQSFTRDVGSSTSSAAIVDSIIGLSKGLDLQVIAEGVETEEQRDWLVTHGCLHYQGFLFGRPGPLTGCD